MRAPVTSYAAGAVAVAATLWILAEARGVLAPLVIAILVWFVLNALAGLVARLSGGRQDSPGLAARAVAALAVIGVLIAVSVMASNSLAGFRENLPDYQRNLREMANAAAGAVGLRSPLGLERLFENISTREVVIQVAGTAAGFASGLFVVLVYVVFLFAEAGRAPAKLAALAPDPERHAELSALIARIRTEIETYLGVKVLVGLAQALPSLLLLSLVGLDGAAFWAVVVFFSSFVPTVGSLIGIVFPSLVAVVQFASPVPVVLTIALLAVIQVAGTNFLEPRLMGSSLNLSPLVILIAIFSGGAVWGITGALVAVPALSIAVIVFARIQSMRSVAVLLSSDGRV